MADACGQARALTVLTPVLPGHDEALRGELDALPRGPDSPLGRLPGTHFARWVVTREHGLLFSATYDAGPADYVEEIRSRLPEEADAVWGHCRGYPGTADAGGFAAYLARHRVRTDLFAAAYPGASLAEVHEALGLRRRLIGFALRAQGMAPAELRAAFREERLA